MTINEHSWTVRFWWLPLVSIAVIVAPIIYIGAVLQRQDTDRQMAPLREKEHRLDEYCSMMRFTLYRVRKDAVSTSSIASIERQNASDEWHRIAGSVDGPRSLIPCMDERAVNALPFCQPGDLACVRLGATYALGNWLPMSLPVIGDL